MKRNYSRNAKSNTRGNYYISDNVVRKEDPYRFYEEDYEYRRRARQEAIRRSARKRSAAKAVMLSGVIAVVVALCVVTLSVVAAHSQLERDINELEKTRASLKEVNDSKEYDIDSSVNLNEVIMAATGELGMVRSSAAQIITYETQDSEYVQQVSEIPTE